MIMSLDRIITTILLSSLCLAGVAVQAAGQLEGKRAPDFTAISGEGKVLRLSQYRGKVVMVNFWATWCSSCRQEMPPLDDLYQRYQSKGFALLGVNIDENFATAKKMARKLNISYPIVFDADKNISRAYQVGAMPMTVIVDAAGVVRSIHYGYKPGTVKKYEDELRRLLQEQ